MRKVTKVTCLFFGLCHGCVHPIWNPFCTRCRPAHPCTSRAPKASSHRKSAAREVWWACPLTKLLKSSRWTLQRWWRSWNERRGPPPRTELTWETRWGFRLRWGWDITTKTCFVRDRTATLTSALHSCKVRHVSKVFRKSVKLQLHGWKDTERDQPGSSAQGLGLLVTFLHLIEICDSKFPGIIVASN